MSLPLYLGEAAWVRTLRLGRQPLRCRPPDSVPNQRYASLGRREVPTQRSLSEGATSAESWIDDPVLLIGSAPVENSPNLALIDQPLGELDGRATTVIMI